MPEVKIIIRHEVKCPIMNNHNILLSLCRTCNKHAYETVDGYVICRGTPSDPRPKEPDPRPKEPDPRR